MDVVNNDYDDEIAEVVRMMHNNSVRRNALIKQQTWTDEDITAIMDLGFNNIELSQTKQHLLRMRLL